MSDTATPEDVEADWGTTGRALDQSDIDDLFGDSAKSADEAPTRKRGFQALVGGALVGIDRLPTLNIIVDRLAQLMTASMRAFTADNADVNIDRVKAIRLGEFLESLTLPTMIAVIRIEQWDGYCLAALDSRLIASVVDVLLGGRRNRLLGIEGRPCTAIERTFLERMANEVITTDLRRAFELICQVEFTLERFESNPAYAAITKPSAAAISFRAEFTMEGRGGHVDFLIPYATLDPVHAQLVQETVGKRQGGDPAWRAHLLETLPSASVTLRAIIERRRISAREVLAWRPGSKLVLARRHDEPIDLLCNELPVFRARIAEKDGQIALHVEERHIASDWPAGS